MNLALFDFDGTITHSDTFTAFIKGAVSARRQRWGRLVLAPSVMGYRMGLVEATTIRQRLIKFAFKDVTSASLEVLGRDHAENYLPTVLRAEAAERIQWHKQRGDRIVVVSASLEVYLKPWCEAMGVELIAVQLETVDGRLTGNYVDGDCTGLAKAERVKSYLDLSDYGKVFAYGDTAEDHALLALADRKFYRGRELTKLRA
ncbi:HAD family hydrolase [Pseudidiomarina homiensis]|uniref:HAD family hydrolase n=1 Tax=Pseudidiomarina homiensis TaxID=364198 RepID=UPI00215A8CC5|nr:HAD-IB family hydrolase [Pseudidiomarina homiensis]